LTLCRIVERAGAAGAARAGSIAQAMPPALAGAVALSHATARTIWPLAAVRADPAVSLETRGLAGGAFFLGLGRTAVTTPLRAGTVLAKQRRAGDAQEQTRRDASNDTFDFHK